MVLLEKDKVKYRLLIIMFKFCCLDFTVSVKSEMSADRPLAREGEPIIPLARITKLQI